MRAVLAGAARPAGHGSCGIFGHAVAVRIIDPSLQRLRCPATGAATQPNRRRKPPGGDAAIKGWPTQRREAHNITNPVVGRRHVRRRGFTHDLRRAERGMGAPCDMHMRSRSIHSRMSERRQPITRPRNRIRLGKRPIRLSPASSHLGRRINRATSCALRISFSGGRRSLVQGESVTLRAPQVALAKLDVASGVDVSAIIVGALVAEVPVIRIGEHGRKCIGRNQGRNRPNAGTLKWVTLSSAKRPGGLR